MLITSSIKFGDKLIVGINSDESVKKIKGDNRPVEDQKNKKEKFVKIKVC